MVLLVESFYLYEDEDIPQGGHELCVDSGRCGGEAAQGPVCGAEAVSSPLLFVAMFSFKMTNQRLGV